MTTILVIDDDLRLCRLLESLLTAQGYAVHLAHTGAQGLELAGRELIDCVILDLGLPDTNGFEVCRALRAWYAGPCIFLSAKDAPADKVTALDLGGDDYLTKPFHASELLARVRACLRRSAAADAPVPCVVCGELTIDLEARRVILAGCELALTRTEYNILALLARHQGKIVDHQQVALQILGSATADDLHTLRVHISNLRKKLRPTPEIPQYIHTVPSFGFRLDAPAPDSTD